MKHTIIIPVLMVCLLLPFGCKKREQIEATTVNGQVRTFGSEDPIIHPPVRVRLLEQVSLSGWGSGYGYEVVDETMTDENQNFTLNGDLDKNKTYYLGIDVESISTAHHYQPLMYLDFALNHPEWQLKSIGGTVHQNFYMVAKGWVKFHFLIDNIQPTDRFAYSVGGGGYEEFYGPINKIRIWDFAGNTEKSIVLGIIMADKDTSWREYFYVPAFDTIEVQIKY